MEARKLLKRLKDDDWYLGDTDSSCRQYVHPDHPGVITVCVRFTDILGPSTLEQAEVPAEQPGESPAIVVEQTRTGASAYSPDIPGCVATGTDEVEARERMSQAMELHLRTLEQKARAGG